MRSKIVFVLLACMLLVGMAAPAMAGEEPVGERINVLAGDPVEFSAGEAFHVLHGWFDFPATTQPGRFDFTLEVDGIDQGKGKLFNFGPGLTGGVWNRLWLFNFPDGLEAGNHTFTGTWWAPCEVAVDAGLWTDTCVTPNAKVEALVLQHTVLFTP